MKTTLPKRVQSRTSHTLLLIALLYFAPPSQGQAQSKSASSAPGASEDVQTQAKRLESKAKLSMGASLGILGELSKYAGGGDVALKNAAAKTEAAIKGIKADSASFDADLKKAREQLQKGREELQKLEGSADVVATYLRERVDPLAKNLSDSEATFRTSLNVLESTAKKISEWQKLYRTLTDVDGNDAALKKIRELVEKEIAQSGKK
jgi:hypothetical protein